MIASPELGISLEASALAQKKPTGPEFGSGAAGVTFASPLLSAPCERPELRLPEWLKGEGEVRALAPESCDLSILLSKLVIAFMA